MALGGNPIRSRAFLITCPKGHRMTWDQIEVKWAEMTRRIGADFPDPAASSTPDFASDLPDTTPQPRDRPGGDPPDGPVADPIPDLPTPDLPDTDPADPTPSPDYDRTNAA
jgi:hypothetical protein